MVVLVTVIVFNSLLLSVCANEQHYDRYSGKVIDNDKELSPRRFSSSSGNCTIVVKHCAPHEGRRIDGTCNNYQHPIRGSARGPYLRLLNPDYANDKQDIRKSRQGGDLPSARKVRTTLQTDGRVVDKHDLTIAAFHYLQFIHRDISILNGSMDYLENRQYCCQPEGRLDRRCKPIQVPDDDPYLRVTDIRCMNFSRAETFQDNGCINETTRPEQINFQTPVIDLSTIYGVDENGLNSVRLYKHGLLKLEYRDYRHVPLANLSTNTDIPETITSTELAEMTVSTTLEDGQTSNLAETTSASATEDATAANEDAATRRRRQTVPVSLPNTGGLGNTALTPAAVEVNMQMPAVMTVANRTIPNDSVCLQNMNNESRCYVFGFPEAGNFDLRTTAFNIFFMREHNRLAKALHHLNSCWKDDRLFKVARQINIATASNIFMYELLPLILGRKNMLKYGLISNHVQHVTAYDEDAVPLVYAEFEIAVRYYHTLLDGRVKLYDEKYHYDGEFSVSNTTYRQSLLEMDKNFEKINRGTFYQPAAKADDIQDPEISEKYYGDLQRAADLPALDIQRGRDLGIRGYNDYRHICGKEPAKKFEDFADVMDYEKIESLKKLYVEIEDIDLLAGIMSENFIPGTFAGPTLFCIMTKQLQLFRFADRFWFERGEQFHSLSLAQLHEIRKTNVARLTCDNADAIKYIQLRAFENVGPNNEHVPCTHIPGLDITQWKDNSCYNDKYFQRDHYHHSHGNKYEFKKYPIIKPGTVKYEENKKRPIHIEDNKNDLKMHWSLRTKSENAEKSYWPHHSDIANAEWDSTGHGGKHKERLSSPVHHDIGKYYDDTSESFWDRDDSILDEKRQQNPIKNQLNNLKYVEGKTGFLLNTDSTVHEEKRQRPIHRDIPKYSEAKAGLLWYTGKNKQSEGTQSYSLIDDGKYDDEIDWPVKNARKKSNQWVFNKRNDEHFKSTSHQNYQSDYSYYTPLFHNIYPSS